MNGWRTMLVAAGAGYLHLLATGTANSADVAPPPSPPGVNDPVAKDGSALDEYFIEIPLRDRPPTSGRTKPTTPPPSTPAPPPDSNPEIDALVKQLGNPDFRQREAAVTKLKEVGPTALPALKRAAEEATDPEVISRASGVVRFLERPRLPGGVPGGASTFADDGFDMPGNVNLRMSVDRGTRRVEVREQNGRVIRIDSGPNGINMAVTGQEDGKPVTRHFQARTPDDLKRQNPEAFELYQRWTGQRDAQLELRRRGNMFRRAMRPPMPIQPGVVQPPGMMEMRGLLRRQLDPVDPFAADAAMRHHEEVMRMFEQMRRAGRAGAVRQDDGMIDPMANDIMERMRRDREAIRNELDAIQNRLRAAEGE